MVVKMKDNNIKGFFEITEEERFSVDGGLVWEAFGVFAIVCFSIYKILESSRK